MENEIQKYIEDQVEKFKSQIINKEYCDATWTLDRLTSVVTNLDKINNLVKKPKKGE